METAKSKGKRGIFALAVGIVAVIMALFLSSLIGHSLVSLNDHSPVLKGVLRRISQRRADLTVFT